MKEEMMQKVTMITRKEIQNIATFNLPLLTEAMRQTELKVQDEHTRKERIDKRVYSLFPVSIGAMSILIASIYFFESQKPLQVLAILISGLIFFVSSVLLLRTFLSAAYSGLGRYPDTWLKEKIIKDQGGSNGNNHISGILLATILHDYQGAILHSDESNSKRGRLLNKAIKLMMIAPLPLVILTIFDLTFLILSK
jgi:hypothetical protein